MTALWRRAVWLCAWLCVAATPGRAADATLPENLPSHVITTGQFQQQRFIRGLLRPLQSSGDFIYHREQGVVWRMRQPLPSLLVLTAQGIWLEGEPQPQLSVLYDLFAALLSGQREQLETRFTVEAARAGARRHLRLSPRDPHLAQFIERVELVVGRELERVTLHEANGDYTVLVFSRVRHPENLSVEQQRWYHHAR